MADQTPYQLGYRMPAEWEPHAATWLAWPHEPRDWPGKFDAVPWVFAEIARHLQDAERIRLIVRDKAEKVRAAQALKASGVKLARVDFVPLNTDRSWTRDSLPISVVKGRGASRQLGLVKWQFNGWAKYPNHKRDNAVPDFISEKLRIPQVKL